jgi:hypothetical protein
MAQSWRRSREREEREILLPASSYCTAGSCPTGAVWDTVATRKAVSHLRLCGTRWELEARDCTDLFVSAVGRTPLTFNGKPLILGKNKTGFNWLKSQPCGGLRLTLRRTFRWRWHRAFIEKIRNYQFIKKCACYKRQRSLFCCLFVI